MDTRVIHFVWMQVVKNRLKDPYDRFDDLSALTHSAEKSIEAVANDRLPNLGNTISSN